METQNNSNNQNNVGAPDLLLSLKSATPLSALQLNNFKLDIKHTVLTPQYLENLPKE